jgi:hypothetical protein
MEVVSGLLTIEDTPESQSSCSKFSEAELGEAIRFGDAMAGGEDLAAAF